MLLLLVVSGARSGGKGIAGGRRLRTRNVHRRDASRDGGGGGGGCWGVIRHVVKGCKVGLRLIEPKGVELRVATIVCTKWIRTIVVLHKYKHKIKHKIKHKTKIKHKIENQLSTIKNQLSTIKIKIKTVRS